MRRRRILYLDPVGEKGGAEVVVGDLARHLDRDRFEPVVACLAPGPFVDELREAGIRTVAFRPHRVRQVHRVGAVVARLGRLIRSESIDIVHANSGHLLFYAGLAACRNRSAVVWHPHDPLDGRGAFERLFRVLQRPMGPDWTVFANPVVAESYLAAYPRIESHDVIVPGVDVEALAGGDAHRARAELGIPEDARVVAMFARLQTHKRHLDVVEAAARLAPSLPDVRYVLCGGSLFGRQPEYAATLQRRIEALGLEDRVILAGYVSDQLKRDLLAASAMVVHSAEHEPFGISVLEGMAVGKPVVAADAAGPSWTVDDGETGFVVPARSVEALTTAIEKVLRDPELAERMGRAGQRSVETRFSVRAMVRAVERVYDRVLESRR